MTERFYTMGGLHVQGGLLCWLSAPRQRRYTSISQISKCGYPLITYTSQERAHEVLSHIEHLNNSSYPVILLVTPISPVYIIAFPSPPFSFPLCFPLSISSQAPYTQFPSHCNGIRKFLSLLRDLVCDPVRA